MAIAPTSKPPVDAVCGVRPGVRVLSGVLIALAHLPLVCTANAASGPVGEATSAPEVTAQVRPLPARYRFDIAEQEVSKALILFGQQADLSVIVQHDARDVQVNGVKGSYTVAEGLNLLLRDTSLEYRYQNRGVVVSRHVSRLARGAPGTNGSFSGDIAGPIAGPLAPTEALAGKTVLPLGTRVGPEELILVTGSRIGLSLSQVSSPMVVMDTDSLLDTGGGNLEQALATLPQNFNGGTFLDQGTDLLASDRGLLDGTVLPGCLEMSSGFDQRQVHGSLNVFGASTLNLRGVGERGTLVLVNGKRMGPSGLLGGYADISSIPMELVERVEIQLDGASALYGSDAIGGVVNIILRDDYEGTTVKLRRTTRSNAGFAGYNALFASTKSWQSGKITGTLSYFKTATANNLLAGEDPAGDFLARTTNAAGDALIIRERMRLASRERADFRVDLDQKLFGDVGMSAAISYTPSHAVHTSVHRLANPASAASAQTTPALNATILPWMTTTGEADRWTFMGDVHGSFGLISQWDWTFGLSHTREDSKSATDDELSTDLVAAAVLDGSLRLFGERSTGANPRDAFSRFLLPTQTFDTTNKDLLIESYVKTAFAALPAGSMQALFGMSTRSTDLWYSHERDSLSRFSPVTANAGLGVFPHETSFTGQVGTNLSDLEGVVQPGRTIRGPASAMTVNSVFAELQVPLLSELPLIDSLSLNAAVRHEDTNPYGSSTTWSIGGVWNVNNDLRLRLRKGTSFAVPAQRLLSLPTITQPIPLFYDDRGHSSVQLCGPTVPCGATIVSGGKSSLLPETAVSWSYGIEYAPSQLKGLRTRLDHSLINFRNRIDGVTPLTIGRIVRLTDDLFDRFGYVYRFDSDGTFRGIDARAINIGSQVIGAYDWSFDYERETSTGTWSLGTHVALYHRFEVRLDPDQVVEDLVGLPHAVPKFKHHARLGWSRGNVKVTVNALHRDDATRRFDAIDSTVSIEYPTVFDVAVTYRFDNGVFGALRNLRANLGVSNLANKRPRWVEASWSHGVPADRRSFMETANTIYERAFYLELAHTFK